MLYFIKSNDFYKIGFTNNINSRMKQYLTENPGFILLGIQEGSKADETNYHRKLAKFIITGEWMKLDEDMVTTLKSEFIGNIEDYLKKSLMYLTTDKWWDDIYKKSKVKETAYNFLIKGHYYTKQELEELFYLKQLTDKPKFYDKFITDNFENFESKRKTINGKKYTVYRFF